MMETSHLGELDNLAQFRTVDIPSLRSVPAQ
jgi:hypothetical protein